MKIIPIVIGGVLAAVVLLVTWLYIGTVIGGRGIAQALVVEILPVITVLCEGQMVPS